MSGAEGRLAAIQERIAAACRIAGRDPAEVRLLAVSKTFSAEAVREVHAAGQLAFGENKQQEADPKIAVLPADIEWHFIGGLQRNKVRKVLQTFHCIHSIDSLRLAETVDRIAGEMGRKAPVYLEVNLGGETSKGGFSSIDLRESASALAALEHLDLLGVMAIPPADGDPRGWFARAREIRDTLSAETGLKLPGLSMGMSGDFEAAILEGSTIVRVGSALFGSRHYP
ncbi:MAG: alanine racemase domain protein [Akkermansiaceae bacterium]|nr:alanine racemase domain protein [Akkermansiaceae bacterium]